VDQSLVRRHSDRSYPVPIKPNCTAGIAGWVLVLAAVLVPLVLGQAFGAKWRDPPPGQPVQIRSQVNYDPKLSDPFFESNEWSYPDNIVKHPDGHFEDTSGGKRPKKEPPHVKHTANCFSTFDVGKHLVKFCEARLLDGNTIELLIHEKNVPFLEGLHVRIRNGMFTCQYWGLRDVSPADAVFMWTTKRQKLTLEKKSYRKGDVIKGRIDFECVQEITNPKYVEKHGKMPETIQVYGVFKTVLK
jgi:hypothetical protein